VNPVPVAATTPGWASLGWRRWPVAGEAVVVVFLLAPWSGLMIVLGWAVAVSAPVEGGHRTVCGSTSDR